jgi:hypothetical protein
MPICLHKKNIIINYMDFFKIFKTRVSKKIPTIEEIVNSPENSGKPFRKIIMDYQDPFIIKNIIIQQATENSVLGRGNEKTGLRVFINSKIPEKKEAALIISDKSFMNKRNYETRFADLIEKSKKTNDTGITPTLYAHYIGNKGYALLLELVLGEKLCDLNFEDEKQQLLLLNAYLTLGKINLIQPDPNCNNIYYTSDSKIKIIDDLSNIEEKYLKDINTKLYYILFTLFNLQRVEKSSLKTFLFQWLSKNQEYKMDNTLNNISDSPHLDENLKKKFEDEIANFISESSTVGGKNKKLKKTYKRYTTKKEKLEKLKKHKKTRRLKLKRV